MFDQRNAQGPGGAQVQRASAAGTPGKTTQTEKLNGGAEPVATVASHHKTDPLHQLHHALNKIAEQVKDKISDKVAEEPEKLLEKLLKKVEKKAEDTISDGLKKGAKSCLTQEEIDQVEAAIHRTRLIAAFDLLKELDKATLAEIHTLHSDESNKSKGKDLSKNVKAAVSALNKFSNAMADADNNLTKLQNVAVCQLQQFVVPQFQELPDQLQLPPLERPKPDDKTKHIGPSVHLTPLGLSVTA